MWWGIPIAWWIVGISPAVLVGTVTFLWWVVGGFDQRTAPSQYEKRDD